MNTTFSKKDLAGYLAKLEQGEIPAYPQKAIRQPVHVVYGGAHLFKADTHQKLGRLALKTIDSYAPNFIDFANIFWLRGVEKLPRFDEIREDLEFRLADDPKKVKAAEPEVYFAWSVYQKTIEKLRTEPVEDLRIDFEDGYGIRPDAEEDGHALTAGDELAKALREQSLPPFCGFRIKSFAPETRTRAVRTFDLFLTNLLEKTDGFVPDNFVVTLPKITRPEEVAVLADLLAEFEKKHDLTEGVINLEIVIETPQALIDEDGRIALRSLVEAGGGRCVAAHFGAYDYTSGLGISGMHQHLGHIACNFARQLMQNALAPLNIRLSDSVTTEMPVPVHRRADLSKVQLFENKRAVENGLRKHFNNVTESLIQGFYQSWDLHPAQLIGRYAAVYAFFLESKDKQAERLRGFLDRATRALLTGNQFDDAASAQGLLNFFIRALYCGALNENEILQATGLTTTELESASFIQILENRRSNEQVSTDF